jgi:hypothetical protein
MITMTQIKAILACLLLGIAGCTTHRPAGRADDPASSSSESWRGRAQEEREGRLLGLMAVQSVGRGGESHADFGCFLEL